MVRNALIRVVHTARLASGVVWPLQSFAEPRFALGGGEERTLAHQASHFQGCQHGRDLNGERCPEQRPQ